MKMADRIAAQEALYRQRMAELAAWKRTQPCKDKGGEVRGDGGCLRCEADAGEACRDHTAGGR
jgi:hypothetical protein